jgi:hypothetical protein
LIFNCPDLWEVFYSRDVFGGGEGGARTCKTAREFIANPGLGISANSGVIAGFGNTYTVLTTEELWSGQQDILQAIPKPRECAHSTGASSFAAWRFPEEFVFPFPCVAHMLPVQQAIPCTTHADANIGAHKRSTAIRHTQAPAILPGAKGKWGNVSMQ